MDRVIVKSVDINMMNEGSIMYDVVGMVMKLLQYHWCYHCLFEKDRILF